MLPQDASCFGGIGSDPKVRIVDCFQAVRSCFARAARCRYPSRSAESYSPIGRIPVGMGGIGEYRGVAFAATSSRAAPSRLIQSASSKSARVTCLLVGSMLDQCSAVAARRASPLRMRNRLLGGKFTGIRHPSQYTGQMRASGLLGPRIQYCLHTRGQLGWCLHVRACRLLGRVA